MARKMHTACMIRLSINKDLKLKQGREKISSSTKSYIQFSSHIRVI